MKKGSITDVDCDAIVNPANSFGVMGGGVAGFLRRVCGEEVEKEAMALSPIPVGSAVTTSAGKLKLKKKIKGIIHAPTMERPAMSIGSENVRLAVLAALREADSKGFEVLAIPGMGTGVGGVPKDKSAKTIIEEIKNFKSQKIKKIILVDVDEEMVDAWKKCLES